MYTSIVVSVIFAYVGLSTAAPILASNANSILGKCPAEQLQLNGTYACTGTAKIYDNATNSFSNAEESWTHTFSDFDGTTFLNKGVYMGTPTDSNDGTSSTMCTLVPFEGSSQWTVHCLSIASPTTQIYQLNEGCDASVLNAMVTVVPSISTVTSNPTKARSAVASGTCTKN
eukprot:Awhi_evm1s15677